MAVMAVAVAVAASSEPTAEIAVMTVLDGATIHPRIVPRAAAISTLPRVLQDASVAAAVVANGAMIAVIAASTVQDGATSPAPIVLRVQEISTAVPHRQDAGEADGASGRPRGAVRAQ